MNTTSHTGRIDTRMHRPAIVEVECEDYAEGLHAHPDTRPSVSCPPRARRDEPSFWLIPMLGLLSLVAVVAVAALALWWPA